MSPTNFKRVLNYWMDKKFIFIVMELYFSILDFRVELQLLYSKNLRIIFLKNFEFIIKILNL